MILASSSTELRRCANCQRQLSQSSSGTSCQSAGRGVRAREARDMGGSVDASVVSSFKSMVFHAPRQHKSVLQSRKPQSIIGLFRARLIGESIRRLRPENRGLSPEESKRTQHCRVLCVDPKLTWSECFPALCRCCRRVLLRGGTGSCTGRSTRPSCASSSVCVPRSMISPSLSIIT